MIKFIVLCTIIAVCVARSLNDDVPIAQINEDDLLAESGASELKDDIAEDPQIKSDVQALLANIESIESDFETESESDPETTRGIFFNRMSTTTSSTGAPFLTLALSLNTAALPQGTTMITMK